MERTSGYYRVVRVKVDLSAASGEQTLLAAVSGKRIGVVTGLLVASGDVNISLLDGSGGTALTGSVELAAAGNGFAIPLAVPPYHHVQTTAGNALVASLDAAVAVKGWLVCVLI